MNQLDCPTPWKRRFETYGQARDEAKRVRKRRKIRLYVYPCPCGWYHTTHQEQYPCKQALTQILWQVAVEATDGR